MRIKINPGRRECRIVKKINTLVKVVTMEEIVRLVKESSGDFLILVEFGEEAESNAKEE